MLLVLRLVLVLKQRFNQLINGRSQTNRDQKLNLLFLQRHDQSQKFNLKFVKIDRKQYKGVSIYCIGFITIKKNR